MIRLLFAAARGARIQRQHFKDNPNFWEAARIIRLGDHDKIDTDYVWRIHPDDEHLQYGPISSALREMAANPSYELAHSSEFGTWALLYKDWCDCRDLASERDVSLFLLILAEASADEGL
jgi:hypothetical protein